MYDGFGFKFVNALWMNSLEIDEAKMKYCKENGSKRAKIVKGMYECWSFMLPQFKCCFV